MPPGCLPPLPRGRRVLVPLRTAPGEADVRSAGLFVREEMRAGAVVRGAQLRAALPRGGVWRLPAVR